jgi:GGDEF domain-containing protein
LKYAKFQQIIFGIMILVILATSVAMMVHKPDAVEIIGQILILATIISGMNWGYRAGIPVTAACIALYIGLRLGFRGEMTTSAILELIAFKGVIYAVLGLLCSHMHNQMRYFFVKLEHQDFIDDETQIGNKRFLLKELTSRINENERYEIPFSLVTFTLNPELVDLLKSSRGVSVLRDISTSILKNDTRSVDELARLDNHLLVILPSTRKDGAAVCCRRLEGKMLRYLEHHFSNGELHRAMQSRILEYPEDRKEIEELVGSIREEIDNEKKPPGLMDSLRR